MKNGIKIPKRESLEKIISGVMTKDCGCLEIKDPTSFKNQVLELSGRCFEQNAMIDEIDKIVKSAENTEQSCFYYIIIVELVRRLIIPRHETIKGSERTRIAEDFIKLMDSAIRFEK